MSASTTPHLHHTQYTQGVVEAYWDVDAGGHVRAGLGLLYHKFLVQLPGRDGAPDQVRPVGRAGATQVLVGTEQRSHEPCEAINQTLRRSSV